MVALKALRLLEHPCFRRDDRADAALPPLLYQLLVLSSEAGSAAAACTPQRASRGRTAAPDRRGARDAGAAGP